MNENNFIKKLLKTYGFKGFLSYGGYLLLLIGMAVVAFVKAARGG